MCGGEIIWARRISNGISRSLDTEISPPYPESWCACLGEVYWKERVVWSPGYFVSTVGLDEKQITEYVRWQGGQDSGQASLDL
jgi:hypothetical protein